MTAAASLGPEQRARVERYAPRVARIARDVHRRVGTLEVDDFTSAGYEALVRAALRYDPGTGVPFEAYATIRVRGAMIDAVRAHNPVPRQRRRAARALAMAQVVAEEAARTEARHQAVAATGHDPRSFRERVEQAVEHIRQTTVAVMVSRVDPEFFERSEQVQSAAMSPDDAVEQAELKAIVHGALDHLEPDERALVEGLYFHGRSMQALADEAGVHKTTIWRRHARILSKLADAMTGEEAGAELAASLQAAASTGERRPRRGARPTGSASPRGPPT